MYHYTAIKRMGSSPRKNYMSCIVSVFLQRRTYSCALGWGGGPSSSTRSERIWSERICSETTLASHAWLIPSQNCPLWEENPGSLECGLGAPLTLVLHGGYWHKEVWLCIVRHNAWENHEENPHGERLHGKSMGKSYIENSSIRYACEMLCIPKKSAINLAYGKSP